MSEPTEAQEAIARGVADYLTICAANTRTFGPVMPGPDEGVGLHLVAGRGGDPVDVAEVGWELVDHIIAAAQTLSRRIITEANQATGTQPTTG